MATQAQLNSAASALARQSAARQEAQKQFDETKKVFWQQGPEAAKKHFAGYGGGGGSSGGGAVAPTPAEVQAQASLVNRNIPTEPVSRAPITPAPVRKVEIQKPQQDYGIFGGLGATAYQQFANTQDKIGTSGNVPIIGPILEARRLIPKEQRAQYDAVIGRPVSAMAAEAGSVYPIARGVRFLVGGLAGLLERAAPVVSRVASRVPGGTAAVQTTERAIQKGGGVVSRVPGSVKSGAVYGTGIGLHLWGATATQGAKESEATTLQKILGGQREQRLGVLETYHSESISTGLSGRINQSVDETGKVISSEIIRPEVGGDDLLGMGQRFGLSGIQGLTSFFISEESKKTAATKALQSQGYPITSQNISAVIKSGESVGFWSSLGIIASETGSEFIGSQWTRGSSAALRAAKTPAKQALALGALTVPRIGAVAVVEGGGQTYNIETLTKREADWSRVFFGAAIGGVSGATFSGLQAVAVPYGFGRVIQGVGYGVDFPGEPGGDVAEKLISRAVGREAGLRIPVLTMGVSGSGTPVVTQKAAPKGKAKTGTTFFSDVFTPSRTVNIGGRSVLVDEFGLPTFTTTQTPSRTETPSITQIPTKTNIPEITDILGPAETTTETTVPTATNINVPSMVNVPTLVPTGLPFFPPGRLGAEGGVGTRRTRLGYFDEWAAAFGNAFGEGRAVSRGQTGRSRTAPRRAMPIFGKTSEFAGFNEFFGSRPAPRAKKQKSSSRSQIFPRFAIRL
ncbi:MAG TPA: hypothetical protein VJH23_01190 [archaeon]|nr:hypothetical protein [archaeon]